LELPKSDFPRDRARLADVALVNSRAQAVRSPHVQRASLGRDTATASPCTGALHDGSPLDQLRVNSVLEALIVTHATHASKKTPAEDWLGVKSEERGGLSEPVELAGVCSLEADSIG
jgi:hypothetical protein